MIAQLAEQIHFARQVGEDAALVVLHRYIRSRSNIKQPRPVMPTFNFGRRIEFTDLRPRHLLMVEEYGIAATYDRDRLRERFLADYHRFFGPLRRPMASDVPSDRGRRERMIENLLDLIEVRRDEYADERASR
jgi:hypothetical protein